MALEGFEKVRCQLPRSFTLYHESLLDICFGNDSLDVHGVQHLNEYLESIDMVRMAHMVKVEFAESMRKEMKGGDETVIKAKPPPYPYDVFLMETTLEQPKKHLAVCLPTRARELAWYNGGDKLYHLDDFTPKWRVASLSGSSRLLEALGAHPTDLTRMAMKRTVIENVATETDLLCLERDWSEILIGMNESQKKAIATAVCPRFDEGFFAIQGPPGTGKTTVIVGMLSVIGSKVLVTAPSNAAVANVALKLFSSGRWRLDEIAVVGENCDPSVRFLNPRYRGKEFATVQEKYEQLCGRPDLQDQLVREFSNWLHVKDTKPCVAELARMCPFINMDEAPGRARYSQMLQSAKVVFCTLNAAGSGVLQNSLDVHTLILDEAGQTPEADFFVATNFPGVKRIIVVGDPKQLPSTVISQACQEVGYGDSWLQKVQDLCPTAVHLLDTQYRMDPKILDFPNRTFYGNRILSGDNVLSREPFVAHPYLFVDTVNRGREEKTGFSYRNVYEATLIKALLGSDSDIRRLLRDGMHTRVIVITPYRAQMKLLQELLKDFIGNGGQCTADVNTVDSYQGQEGDVVILSTVRTKGIGFVGDSRRLNVALTRAKRILRVVGEADCFRKLVPSSTLRKLVEHGEEQNAIRRAQIRALAWTAPDWQQPMLWKPVGNTRFYDCLQKMTSSQKNICLNTLLAVAKPDVGALNSRVRSSKIPAWHTARLRGRNDAMEIVWIVREGNEKPVIEAHFAGASSRCRRFVQMNSLVPDVARVVKTDLSGLERQFDTQRLNGHSDQPITAWPMTNSIQRALFDEQALPTAGVQLDSHQERVARSQPPLLVESRSGTGKTLILLQHAAYHADRDDARAGCFVTVSPRLRSQLQLKYEEMHAIENIPPMLFFSFEALLDRLIDRYRIEDFKGFGRCRFPGFVKSRRSHQSLAVDIHLTENEIGGVIAGSLDAARQQAPLSREQYFSTKRSNVGKSQEGCETRSAIYETYTEYTEWKKSERKFDIHDLVLRLLKEKPEVLFASGYLDEVQDLSYASIYLLCSLAGRDSLSPAWVCAGDPAQMISPGCSFTFDGLKETLLSLRGGIEASLKNVSHLVVNYRTTIDVLKLGNAILAVAKREFPGAIGFAHPETSKKDLGYKVLLCDWDAAWAQKVRLGPNQALIHMDQDHGFQDQAKAWIGAHPFILSSLDSKGLEFDDVIVAFDLPDRKLWDISAKRVASLRMLRELYVAVTRARRRVVILMKKKSGMPGFFDSLYDDFQTSGASLILQEFDKETTPEQWSHKGKKLFDDEQYAHAARCFEAAGDNAWEQLAVGRQLYQDGSTAEAVDAYRRSLHRFFNASEFEHVLDRALEIHHCGVWNETETDNVLVSLRRRPDYFERADTLKLSLLCGNWNELSVDDLKDATFSAVILRYRGEKELQRFVSTVSSTDRKDIEESIPGIVGDIYRSEKTYDQALRLYLEAFDLESATEVTNATIQDVQRGRASVLLSRCADIWIESSIPPPADPLVALFLRLFENPTKEARTSSTECMRDLGRAIVTLAIDHTNVDRTALYDFDPSMFTREVTEFLVSRHVDKQLEVVKWFLSRGDSAQATAFVRKRCTKWNISELCTIAVLLQLSNGAEWFFARILERKLTAWCLLVVIGSQAMSVSEKQAFCTNFVEYVNAKTPTQIPKRKNTGGFDGLSRMEQSVVGLLGSLCACEFHEFDTNDLVSACVYSWPKAKFEQTMLQMRTIAMILESAEPGLALHRFRPVYRAVFERASNHEIAVAIVLSAREEKDRLWLLRAFDHYELKLAVSAEQAAGFVRLAVLADFRNRALDYSWTALSSRALTETSWTTVLDSWMVAASEQARSWLLQGFIATVAVHISFAKDASLLETMLATTPYKTKACADETTRYLVNYGPAVLAYIRRREETYNAATPQQLVSFHAQLRTVLAERLVEPTTNGTTKNGKKRNQKKKNRAGKQDTAKSTPLSATAPVYAPSNSTPANAISKKNQRKNKKKGNKKKNKKSKK